VRLKRVFVVCLTMLFQHSIGETKQNYEDPPSEYGVIQPRL